MRKRKSTPLPESEHEDRRTIIEKLVEQGYQNKEIAEKTGIPVGSVARYATAFRKQKKEKEKGKPERMGIGICVCPASTEVRGQKSMDVTMQGLWSTAEDAQ